MDWNYIKSIVVGQLKQNGVAVDIVVTTSATAYNATTDSYTETLATYEDVMVVFKNPTMQNEAGVFSKSDRLQMLIPATGMPASLDQLPYKIISGSTAWLPEKTVAIKPGGIPVLFIADLK
jgi:hypothetical protein